LGFASVATEPQHRTTGCLTLKLGVLPRKPDSDGLDHRSQDPVNASTSADIAVEMIERAVEILPSVSLRALPAPRRDLHGWRAR